MAVSLPCCAYCVSQRNVHNHKCDSNIREHENKRKWSKDYLILKQKQVTSAV